MFSKILSQRVSKHSSLAKEQRGFIPSDGAAQNIFSLDFILRYALEKCRTTHIASLDIVKAFDSVSFESVFTALHENGIHLGFSNMIKLIFNQSSTSFEPFNDRKFIPTCGVRQGDPLSPILFNIVVYFVIKSLRSDIGIQLDDGSNTNISAYADDLFLFASSVPGLQHLLDNPIKLLSGCNQEINLKKSFTISIISDGENKKTKIDTSHPFRARSTPIRLLIIKENFKYLGVTFTAHCLLAADCTPTFDDYVTKFASAPVKAQQRIWILRSILLPKIFHLLVLSSIQAGHLAKLDARIRAFVRKVLYLSADCPNAYLHAAVSDSELSVPSLRYSVPV
ncbi:Retrovirus-related Pol polyprotein from type-2 retrotransposable element R2DM [Araneus ventricosus]|uniref:Retrovirus-related Pol polyprotein from type-2 retrotransposable element R2DM n=1 Tax=Araneus ventricosus TaxID=182803 RepID=A0A4Y2L1L4_ARAVE|nr:Retrovirus-related Pol polyprotein from type-2 retrotransposable element R2DM [Araneus ventricosus]